MTRNTQPEAYIIGDIHGQHDKLVQLLKRTGLISDTLSWTGGQSSLWFLGDFCDRGPDGVGVLDLVMSLQQEALDAGGAVQALLGNHEIVVLAALWMGDLLSPGWGDTFRSNWVANGGVDSDLSRLEDRHTEWMLSLPSLALVGDTLLMHANSLFYLKYGSTISRVNQAITALLRRKDPIEWDRFIGECGRDFGPDKPDSAEKVTRLLRTFGANRLVHGHTSISDITGADPSEVTRPLVYEGGKCVDVDAGMYLGSPGFVYKLHMAVS